MPGNLFGELTPERLRDRVPELTIGGPAAASRAREGAPAARALEGGGWLEAPLLSGPEAERLATGVDRLAQAELPLVALYAFDEAWAAGEHARRLVERATGAPYAIAPDLWTFRVLPGARGWTPHRGSYARLDRARPESINVWIALSDVERDRACLHVLPLDADDAYRAGDLDRAPADAEARGRAVPVPRGAMLAWNANVLHWGGACSPTAAGPRVSFTFTLVRADAGMPSYDAPPEPWERLSILARQILVYGAEDDAITPAMREWATLTTKLAGRPR